MVKVFKLYMCQHQCRRTATNEFEKLLHSQSVSLQHAHSETGHLKEGRSNALHNLVVHIFKNLSLGLNSMNHRSGFIFSTVKIVKPSFASRETAETLN